MGKAVGSKVANSALRSCCVHTHIKRHTHTNAAVRVLQGILGIAGAGHIGHSRCRAYWAYSTAHSTAYHSFEPVFTVVHRILGITVVHRIMGIRVVQRIFRIPVIVMGA